MRHITTVLGVNQATSLIKVILYVFVVWCLDIVMKTIVTFVRKELTCRAITVLVASCVQKGLIKIRRGVQHVNNASQVTTVTRLPPQSVNHVNWAIFQIGIIPAHVNLVR